MRSVYSIALLAAMCFVGSTLVNCAGEQVTYDCQICLNGACADSDGDSIADNLKEVIEIMNRGATSDVDSTESATEACEQNWADTTAGDKCSCVERGRE